jgi:hypothetical protein
MVLFTAAYTPVDESFAGSLTESLRTKFMPMSVPSVGDGVGTCDGAGVGFPVGENVGLVVGSAVGLVVGTRVDGKGVGLTVG